MKSKNRQLTLPEIAAIWLCGIIIAWFLLKLATPAEHSLDVVRMDITSAVFGQPIIVDYQREVHKNFAAERVARVDRSVGGVWTDFCPPYLEKITYHAGMDVRRPVYLTRFAGENCDNLPPGDYRLVSRWDINPYGLRGLLFSRWLEKIDRFSVVEAP